MKSGRQLPRRPRHANLKFVVEHTNFRGKKFNAHEAVRAAVRYLFVNCMKVTHIRGIDQNAFNPGVRACRNVHGHSLACAQSNFNLTKIDNAAFTRKSIPEAED